MVLNKFMPIDVFNDFTKYIGPEANSLPVIVIDEEMYDWSLFGARIKETIRLIRGDAG